MNRVSFLKHLEERKWKTKLLFDGKGPIMLVIGQVNGIPFKFQKHVPCFVMDDHQPYIDDLYSAVENILNKSASKQTIV